MNRHAELLTRAAALRLFLAAGCVAAVVMAGCDPGRGESVPISPEPTHRDSRPITNSDESSSHDDDKKNDDQQNNDTTDEDERRSDDNNADPDNPDSPGRDPDRGGG